jgi:hypothetical protein
MMNCPDCHEEVPDEARRCRACGRWLRDARSCPQCGETVLAIARVCRFCAYDLVADPLNVSVPEAIADALPHTLHATPFGGMICEQSITALFFPPRMVVSEDEIRITKWTLFGLRTSEQKVGLGRVASVRTHKGVIWAGVIVETFGGSIGDLAIVGLNKAEAQETVEILERIAPSAKKPPPAAR